MGAVFMTSTSGRGHTHIAPCKIDSRGNVSQTKPNDPEVKWWGVYEVVHVGEGREFRWLFDCSDRDSAQRAQEMVETTENQVKAIQFAMGVLDLIDGNHPEDMGLAPIALLAEQAGMATCLKSGKVKVTFGKGKYPKKKKGGD